MQPVVLHVHNAKANMDLIRRGLSGAIADLDSAAVFVEGQGMDAGELRVALDTLRNAAGMVEQASHGIEAGCEAILASEPYMEYHMDTYGMMPMGVLQ